LSLAGMCKSFARSRLQCEPRVLFDHVQHPDIFVIVIFHTCVRPCGLLRPRTILFPGILYSSNIPQMLTAVMSNNIPSFSCEVKYLFHLVACYVTDSDCQLCHVVSVRPSAHGTTLLPQRICVRFYGGLLLKSDDQVSMWLKSE
jgi:hypothetical protein